MPRAIEHARFHDGSRTLAVASARWGNYANLRREHPYALTVARDDGLVACLCDGSGDWGEGVAASRIAAHVAAQTCAANLSNVRDALMMAFASAHEQLLAYPRDEFGAACSGAIVVIREGVIHVGWVGSIEVLVLRRGELLHRTEGHFLWRDLVRSGQLANEDVAAPFKDIVTRSLGIPLPGKDAAELVDVAGPWVADVGDLILLCSRRIYSVLSESDVLSCAMADDLGGTVRRLLLASLANEDYFEACAIAIRVDA